MQGVEPLTVRMINSVMKKCEVKPKFHETFAGDGCASEFGYRQRVLLLFQNLDGVDVCLFCMYVQEYGKDCAAPNTNVVYLSYLDSVKYFRPEIPCAMGPNVSLRTFVYHQLLIGYLDFVKRMGYEQMYIWACPPMQVRALQHTRALTSGLGSRPDILSLLLSHALVSACPRNEMPHAREA